MHFSENKTQFLKLLSFLSNFILIYEFLDMCNGKQDKILSKNIMCLQWTFQVCLFHLKFLTGVTDLFLQQKPLRGTHPPQNTHIHSSPQQQSGSWAFKGTTHIYFGCKNPCKVFQFSLLTCADVCIPLSDGMICNLSV